MQRPLKFTNRIAEYSAEDTEASAKFGMGNVQYITRSETKLGLFIRLFDVLSKKMQV